jgi:hypothetical protein
MRYAVLQGNVVANIAVADEPLAGNWIDAQNANIGDVWDGEKFATPTPTEEDVKEQWAAIRAERDAKLTSCDWTQIADAPVDAAAWAAYRQALRDVPNTQTDPFNIVWPTPPAA